jgi:hypothetical protein
MTLHRDDTSHRYQELNRNLAKVFIYATIALKMNARFSPAQLILD